MTCQNATLPLTSCILLDIPDSHWDCSPNNGNCCISCIKLGRFITEESVDEMGSPGHVLCTILWVITLLVGVCGTFGNIFIMYILRRQKRGTAFDTFLVALALIDLVCSVTCIITNTSAVIYFENLSRGIATLYFFQLGSHTALFSKSASSFMTVLITVERYLAVAFPMRTRSIVTQTRTRLLVVGVVSFSFLMAIPRYSSMKIAKNLFWRDIKSTERLDYMIQSTSLNKFWYGTLKGFFNQIDFWLPLPLLLLFNGLVYLHILKFTSRRQDMKMGQRKEIRAVRMFLPVVVVLFLCNIIPIIHYAFIQSGTAYRELHLANFLSFAFNSAANLPIYYAKGSGFRKETRAVLTEVFPALEKWIPQVDKTNTSGAESSGGK